MHPGFCLTKRQYNACNLPQLRDQTHLLEIIDLVVRGEAATIGLNIHRTSVWHLGDASTLTYRMSVRLTNNGDQGKVERSLPLGRL